MGRRLIVGITGASGVIYGIRCLEMLKKMNVESHLVLSPSAIRTIHEETDYKADDVRQLADVVHSFSDIGAKVSSGSYLSDGMLVIPCSIKTLSGIANSYNEDLVVRAADVCLKERRKVVLMVRETPLHPGHMRLMSQASENGAIIMPPVPAFYQRPETLDDIIDHTVGRALDLFGLESGTVVRWDGKSPK